MIGLGLSEAAVAERRKYLGAGDAAAVMSGDWQHLWRIKTGRAKEESLADKLPVQMGLYTEPANLAWCQQQTGRPIEYYSGNRLMAHIWLVLTERIASPHELQVNRAYPWMACNLDGMTTTAEGLPCVIDAKHVGRSDDPMILRYSAAGTHQATVMDTDYWALSVFVGNSKWELIEQRVDPIYQAQLITREAEFWHYVERDEEPPEAFAPLLPPKPTPKLRTLLVPTDEKDAVYQAMVTQNNWLPAAVSEIAAFVGTQAAATRNAIARKKILEALPEDVGELVYGRFKAKRSKNSAVTMTVAPMEDET